MHCIRVGKVTAEELRHRAFTLTMEENLDIGFTMDGLHIVIHDPVETLEWLDEITGPWREDDYDLTIQAVVRYIDHRLIPKIEALAV